MGHLTYTQEKQNQQFTPTSSSPLLTHLQVGEGAVWLVTKNSSIGCEILNAELREKTILKML